MKKRMLSAAGPMATTVSAFVSLAVSCANADIPDIVKARRLPE